ncbi:MAG: Hsp20/alpha crystallin family protein [Candidatus Heimdallarchaeota archaeon]|nr:Hsp20/alpha crystallin family protein [Candidatus Heimdallarchaeota archaeon]
MNNENDKDKDKDIYRKGFNEEFRKVRFFSNVNGVKKEYGYDYDRDSEGKENYREIGEIPDEFGKEYIERILNLNKTFDWDAELFSRSLKRFAEIFPGIERVIGSSSKPQLTSGVERETKTTNHDIKDPHQVAYDLQVDPEKNQLYLIVELPGFSKDQVKIKLVKNQLVITAENGKKQIDTKIPIEYDIDKQNKIEASMRNGILEVKLKILKESNSNGEDISIS